MAWYQLVVLAVVQGVTEFLPISSSAHLVLVPHFLGWIDQGLAFDLAMHLGTLVAVLVYFRTDVARLFVAWGQSMTRGRRDGDVAMAWGILLATVPALAFGVLIGILGQDMLRTAGIIATMSIVFGILLGVADVYGRQDRAPASLTWRTYLAIGFAQAVAIIPGASRSGMTILAGRAAGLDRSDAARLSFFLAIPITAAAIAFEVCALLGSTAPIPWGALGIAALLACVSALLAIHYFLRMLQSMGMMPFVIYRVLLGLLLFAMFGWSG